MTTITEGDITLTFPAGWRAIKYDDTQFCRNHMLYLGADLKAVDILASRPPFDSLLAIEIKDFRGHAAANRSRQTSGELEKEVIQKILHTFSGLYLTAFSGVNDLKYFCQGSLGQPASVEYVLLMEEDGGATPLLEAHRRKTRQNMELKLKKLKHHANLSFKILSMQEIRPRDGWRAV